MLRIPAKYRSRNLYGYGNFPPDMSTRHLPVQRAPLRSYFKVIAVGYLVKTNQDVADIEMGHQSVIANFLSLIMMVYIPYTMGYQVVLHDRWIRSGKYVKSFQRAHPQFITTSNTFACGMHHQSVINPMQLIKGFQIISCVRLLSYIAMNHRPPLIRLIRS